MFDFKKFNDYELLYLFNRHSEEALAILLEKYSHLIEIKLYAFRVRQYQIDDFKQECMLALMRAIQSFSETYNKTFYRYAELIIERRIMNLLRHENYYQNHLVLMEDFERFNSDIDVEKTSIYKKILKEVLEVKMLGIKGEILKEVFFDGVTIEEFASKRGLDRKDVYNHIYLLRSIIKKNVL